MQSKTKVMLVYGASGTTKSVNIANLIEWVWDKFQKRTRIISADGGAPDYFNDYVEAGMAEAEFVGPQTSNPTEHIDRLCQGYWPSSKGGQRVWTKDGLDAIGAYAIEGLASIGDLVMADLRSRGARLSQDPNFTLKMGETTYYGSNMTYFGFVQDRIYDFVMKTHMLPVEIVYWTSTEAKGEEEGTKSPIYGPAIAGKKSIGKAPQWFGDCLHSELVVVEGGEDKNKQVKLVSKPVLYIRSHADKMSKIPFPAKVRIPPAFVAELDKSFPEGFIDPPDIRRLFEVQERFRNAGLERLRGKVASVPAPSAAEKVTA